MLTRQTRLRKAAVEGRLTQRPSCGVARRQIGEGRIPQDRRVIDVMHQRQDGLWRIFPAHCIVADNSDRARRHPTIVVQRGNMRSSDLRCSAVGDHKMRSWRRHVRYGQTWRNIRCGRREMRRWRREMWYRRGDVRTDNWPLRFRIVYQSGEDEGYHTNSNQSHDYKPNGVRRRRILRTEIR